MFKLNSCIFFLIFTCNIVSYAEVLNKVDTALAEWASYKARHGKYYLNVLEDNFRFKLFSERTFEVERHNRRASSFKLEVNEMSDWTRDELDNLHGFNPDGLREVTKVKPKDLGFSLNDEIPESFDWRERDGVVGPVKNQGNCGSCWAFSTTGLLEGQERANDTAPTQLSQQQLIDCDKGNSACRGGASMRAITYIVKEGGLQTDLDYPYSSGEGLAEKCRADRSKVFPATKRVARVEVLTLEDEDELKRLLVEYGPISISMFAPLSLTFYKSGVYNNQMCETIRDTNHEVLLVGYGRDQKSQLDYWIMKNSWGQSFGQKGYFWLERNRGGHCSILSWPTIAIMNRY